MLVTWLFGSLGVWVSVEELVSKMGSLVPPSQGLDGALLVKAADEVVPWSTKLARAGKGRVLPK